MRIECIRRVAHLVSDKVARRPTVVITPIPTGMCFRIELCIDYAHPAATNCKADQNNSAQGSVHGSMRFMVVRCCSDLLPHHHQAHGLRAMCGCDHGGIQPRSAASKVDVLLFGAQDPAALGIEDDRLKNAL